VGDLGHVETEAAYDSGVDEMRALVIGDDTNANTSRPQLARRGDKCRRLSGAKEAADTRESHHRMSNLRRRLRSARRDRQVFAIVRRIDVIVAREDHGRDAAPPAPHEPDTTARALRRPGPAVMVQGGGLSRPRVSESRDSCHVLGALRMEFISGSPQQQQMTPSEPQTASPTARLLACLGALASSKDLFEQYDSLRAPHDRASTAHQTASHDVSEAHANVRDAVRAYGAWLRTEGVSLAGAEAAIREQLAAADLTVDQHSPELAADLVRCGIMGYNASVEPPPAPRSAPE
jgi:hypothetical protein